MQMAVTGENHNKSLINMDPNQPDTIYSALSYAHGLCEKQKLGIAPVTFDQPLYIKAVDIVQSSPDLDKVVVRLGGFHLIMSYMGAIGAIMGGSGLAELWVCPQYCATHDEGACVCTCTPAHSSCISDACVRLLAVWRIST